MNFEKRLTAPTNVTKWYKDSNPFFYSKYSMFKKHTKYLGNCTHYAYSRGSEILNKKSALPSSNADTWFNKTDYKKGNTPKLGSIVCYKHKNKSGGHLGVVEEIDNEGNLLLSMSGWNSYLFKTKMVYKNQDYVYGDYDLMGFIYLIDDESDNLYQGEFPVLPKIGYFKNKDKGKEVKKLQKFLNWANDASIKVDGVIGPKTKEQVKIFQKKVNVGVDGLFGSKTLAKALTYQK